MNCNEKILNLAKILNDMFPGEVKDKVEFVRNYEDCSEINELVSAYLTKIGGKKKGRSSWPQSVGISII